LESKRFVRTAKRSKQKLEKTNEQLQIHDKMQTEFVNIAAHELRTPVQPILAMVDMLKDDLEGKKEAIITEEVVAILERNSHRLQKLSSEILDATRIESGTLRLEQSLIDLNVKVRNVVEDSKSLIRQGQKILIQFKPYIGASRNDNAAISPPSPLPVMVDKLRMFEVISNLIRNAIKYSSSRSDGGSPESGRTITVSTEKQGNEAIVSVKDQGVGINPDFMPRLFTKFATDRVSGGTGLGLYISKAILEAHGGRIWAENNKDGKGATFYFALPLAKEGFDPQQLINPTNRRDDSNHDLFCHR
jgi:signal transduction histidine kinase